MTLFVGLQMRYNYTVLLRRMVSKYVQYCIMLWSLVYTVTSVERPILMLVEENLVMASFGSFGPSVYLMAHLR